MRSFLKISSCLCALFLASVTMSHAQTVTFLTDNSPTTVSFLVPHFNPMFGLSYVNPNKSLIEVAEGSQYMNDEFKRVTTASKDVVVETRYNAFNDEMEIKKEDKLGWVNKERHQNNIVLAEDGTAYKILDSEMDPEVSELGYYQVLINSNYVSLYKKNTKILAVGHEQGPYMTPPPKTITEFQEVKTEYFIEFNNSGIAKRLPSTRGRIAKIFKKNKKDIINYIKEHNLKVTRDEDMIKIFIYINALL